MVAVAYPVVLANVRSVVITELVGVPFSVQYEVYVDGSVSSATKADVMVMADDRVERSIVDEPITTMLLDLPVSVFTMPDVVEAGARVDVAT